MEEAPDNQGDWPVRYPAEQPEDIEGVGNDGAAGAHGADGIDAVNAINRGDGVIPDANADNGAARDAAFDRAARAFAAEAYGADSDDDDGSSGSGDGSDAADGPDLIFDDEEDFDIGDDDFDINRERARAEQGHLLRVQEEYRREGERRQERAAAEARRVAEEAERVARIARVAREQRAAARARRAEVADMAAREAERAAGLDNLANERHRFVDRAERLAIRGERAGRGRLIRDRNQELRRYRQLPPRPERGIRDGNQARNEPEREIAQQFVHRQEVDFGQGRRDLMDIFLEEQQDRRLDDRNPDNNRVMQILHIDRVRNDPVAAPPLAPDLVGLPADHFPARFLGAPAGDNGRETLRPGQYPLVFTVDVNCREKTFRKIVLLGGDDLWSVQPVIRHYKERDLAFIDFVLEPLKLENQILKAEMKFICNDKLAQGAARRNVCFVFDKDHPIMYFKNVFQYARLTVGNSEWLLPERIDVELEITRVTRLDEFTFHNVVFYDADRWIVVGKKAIRLQWRDFEMYGRNFDRVEESLESNSPVEFKEAFIDFAFAFLHRVNFMTKKWKDAMFGGYKLGLINSYWDTDSDEFRMPFPMRTFLPIYPRIGNTDFRLQADPIPSSTRKVNFLRRFPLRLDMSNPSETYYLYDVEDAHPIQCQFTFWVEQTHDEKFILMAGLIYSLRGVDFYVVTGTIDIMHRGISVMHSTGRRFIHPQQKTFGMVVGIFTDEDLRNLRNSLLDVHVLFAHEPTTRKSNIYSYASAINPDTMKVETYPAMPGPINEMCHLVDIEESHERGEPAPVPLHPIWANQVSGFLICHDNKTIAVNKEYLSIHSEYMRYRFYADGYADCGKSRVHVHEKAHVVMDALNILYHKQHVLKSYKVGELYVLAMKWMCEPILQYLDIAMVNNPDITGQREIGETYNRDLIKYAVNHPQYHVPNWKSDPVKCSQAMHVDVQGPAPPPDQEPGPAPLPDAEPGPAPPPDAEPGPAPVPMEM